MENLKPCPICGELFAVTRSNRRYCSMECRSGVRNEIRKCEQCGADFEAYMSEQTRHCSVECGHKTARAAQDKKVALVCQGCGQTYRVSCSRARVSKFCSKECLGASNGRRKTAEMQPRIPTPCATCGVIVEVRPCLVGRKKYCSKRCRSIGGLKSANRRPRTSKIGDDAIIYWAEYGELGRDLQWEPEYRVSKWTVDLAFPELMLAIELDGVYWHGRPEIREKDAVKNLGLTSRGWRVHHIPIEAEDTPAWLARCIDVALAYTDPRINLSRIPAAIVEAS